MRSDATEISFLKPANALLHECQNKLVAACGFGCDNGDNLITRRSGCQAFTGKRRAQAVVLVGTAICLQPVVGKQDGMAALTIPAILAFVFKSEGYFYCHSRRHFRWHRVGLQYTLDFFSRGRFEQLPTHQLAHRRPN